MKYTFLIISFFLCTLWQESQGQALKVNAPFLLAGSPNLGVEFTVSNQLAINGDVLWLPYMFKESESVFKVFQSTIDLRYYVNPKYYHNNNMFDGFYLGPYVMYGQYNIGINRHSPVESNKRYVGWGMSLGVSMGYKFYLSRRFRLDINLGVGVAHLAYDTYFLGREWAEYPIGKDDTELWVGPTKFGVNLVYNINIK